MQKITQKSFNILINSDHVVIDFYADWCGPCKMMAPIFEKVAKDIKDIKFSKIDVDLNQEIAKENNILSIPTTIIFKKGKEAKRFSGFMSENDLLDFIK